MQQFAKYLVVGGLANLLAYIVYILITFAGASPIVGMSVVYLSASLTSFAVNRGWTFRSERSLRVSVSKYLLAQLLGYGTNLFILYLLYYILDIPHQTAQLIGIAVVAVQLFLLPLLRF